MGFFDDMTAAVETYPEDNVRIEIIEVEYPGTVLNVDDVGSFRVKVTNTGPLHLTGVTLLIKGVHGTKVAANGAAALFVDEFEFPIEPQINAHGGYQITNGNKLKFKPTVAYSEAESLVRASLEGWDGNVNHIMNAHSDPLTSVNDIYVSSVAGT